MEANKIRANIETSSAIEAILREHESLEQIIRERFQREVTILFTDICGYTQYTETMGDIRSRVMLQKHNDILLPLIAKYNGMVIKTIGDAVMATFKSPTQALKAAIHIQNALDEYNQREADSIHVKIGINTGQVLLDEGDIFGDAVNVAARIQAKAGKDEILISENLFEQIGNIEDFVCRFHSEAELKGKAKPIRLYQVIWREEEQSSSIHHPSSPERVCSHIKKQTSQPVLHIDITRIENHLKVSAYEQFAGESETVRHYEEIPVLMERIAERCNALTETLNKANRQGAVAPDMLGKLREICQIFFDDLLTHTVKEKIRETKAEHLILNLDDTLVHIPWELLHDGNQFLCQRFAMGRLVRTRQRIPGNGKARMLAKPLKMLILADPVGDLNGAYTEGLQLRDNMELYKNFVNVSLRADNIPSDYVREKLRNFDMVHYAGHSDYDRKNPAESGWRLSKGRFKAQEIMKMAGTGAMPALIFSNACQSARTEGWELTSSFHDEIFGLANAFVLAGVKHYVGTFWEILDEPGRRFALDFYKNLLSGMSIGEAIRDARLTLIREYGEETIVWASYLLYGDPTSDYMLQAENTGVRSQESGVRSQERESSLSKAKIRAYEDIIDFSEPPSSGSMKSEKDTVGRRWDLAGYRKNRWKRLTSLVIGILLLLGFLLWGYPGILKKDNFTNDKASEALAAYQRGDFKTALALSESLEKKAPCTAYLIQGDIYLRQGNLNSANEAYQKSLRVPGANKNIAQQKADAFIGLGRIASLRKETDKALNYYHQASEITPSDASGYLFQGMLMNEAGNYETALEFFKKAYRLSPENRLLASITKETRNRVLFLHDQEKQERINKLVKELLGSQEKAKSQQPIANSQQPIANSQQLTANTQQPTPPPWTSPPLTLWMMDFQVQGYAIQEGEHLLLAAGIADALIQERRIQLTERILLDKLLEELKLGTSRLTDPATALSLGKLLAARLILTGNIIYSSSQAQISLRLIETETGHIRAAISEVFENALSSSDLTDKITEKLINKIKELYPIRGIISKINGNEIILNIGEKIGIATGDHFKVIHQEELILKVVSTDAERSTARSIKALDTAITEGMRVEVFPYQNIRNTTK